MLRPTCVTNKPVATTEANLVSSGLLQPSVMVNGWQ
jgi:hypothetical protein